jgi:hypothetical protein
VAVDDAVDRPSGTVRGLPRLVVVGLIGVVVAFIGIGSLHALQLPPFWATDETAHVGYAHEVASFHLPEITTVAEVPTAAWQWESERSTADDLRYRGVWVANHPPLYYTAVAPLIWYSNATGATDGGLILMRFANVAFAAVGVVFTFLLARELTRGNDRLALLAAALAALVPQGHAVFSQALNDGLGFAAGTAVVWAGARCLRRIDALSRADLLLLAGTTVVAFGARAATMLVAVLVVGVVALRALGRPAPTLGQRIRRSASVAAVGLVPALVAFGWFYVRNMALYGDIGASSYLLDRFDRDTRGSVLDMILRRPMWEGIYGRLMTASTRGRSSLPGSLLVTALAAGGAVVALVTGRTSGNRDGLGGDGDRDHEERATLRWQVALAFATVGVIALTIAQHASGGGNAHARYAMPAIGAAAVLVVIGAERVWTRWGPMLVVMIAGWWALINLPVDVDPVLLRRNRDDGQLAPLSLRVLPLSDGWRTAAGVLIVSGVVVAVGVMAATLRSGDRGLPGSGMDRPEAPGPDRGGELVSAGSEADRN